MSEKTKHLKLPYIMSNQAQKEVTHNEALDLLDFWTARVVKAKTSTPPAAPENGDGYIIASGATGAWTGKENILAIRINGSWTYAAPFNGAIFYSLGESREYLYKNSAWVAK